MTADIASTSVTSLPASSPFTASGGKKNAAQVSPTILTHPGRINQQAINIAFSFAPSGSLALLARPTANLLLDTQATQKQHIPQGHSTNTTSKSSADTSSSSSSSGGTANAYAFSTASNALSQASSLGSTSSSSGSFSVSA